MPTSGATRTQVRADIATHAARMAHGLVIPNPANALLSPIPTVMASPPTITVGGPVPTLTGWRRVPNFPEMRFLGFDIVLGTNPVRATSYYANSGQNNVPTSLDFDFDGASFEVYFTCTGTARTWQLWVDGQLAFAPYYSGATGVPGDGAVHYTLVDFGNRASRHIRIMMEEVLFFGGIQTKYADTISYPRRPKGPKIVVVGDSWTCHNFLNNTQWYEAWPFAMGRALGSIDVASLGIGSTGYLATGVNGGPYSTRLDELLHVSPDLFIVQSSLNDRSNQGFSTAQTQTAVASYIPGVRSRISRNTPIVVIAPFWNASTGNAQANPVYDSQLTTLRDGIQATVLVSPKPLADGWIDPLQRGWIQGNGTVESPNGSGNADVFISQSHPNGNGAAFLGERVAEQISKLLPFVVW